MMEANYKAVVPRVDSELGVETDPGQSIGLHPDSAVITKEPFRSEENIFNWRANK